MTEKEYRSHPAVSRSELFKLTESPEKFRFYKDNPQPPTPALIFGQAFHKMALQPNGFGAEFAVAPTCDRRTTEGKRLYLEFLEENDEKTIITQEDFKKCMVMCDTLHNYPIEEERKLINALLSGQKEQPFFWVDEMTGEECKCRTDCISGIGDMDVIVDLKSAADASQESFLKDAIKYGYDFQAAMYKEGVKARTGKDCPFVFIVVEKDPPYAVNIFQADELFVKRGYDIFRELIGIYHDCKQTGNWYGYLGKFNMINNLALPAWLAKEIE